MHILKPFKLRGLLFLSISIISCSYRAEENTKPEDSNIRISLDTFYVRKSKGFLILQDIAELEDSLAQQITFPDLSGIKDTAFTQLYFTGDNSNAMENQILVLVGNYSSTSPLLWIDYNNDLQFPDSAAALLFSSDALEVYIPNVEQPKLYHALRLLKPDSATKAEASPMIKKYITKGKPFADFYFDQRRNIRVGDFVFQQDSLRIGLMDYNINGSYHDLGSDRIVTGNYGGKINGTEEVDGAVIIDSTTYFNGQNLVFEVVEMAEDGSSIVIRPTLSDHGQKHIATGDSIEDYGFKLLSGESVSIHDFLAENKMLYLSFWATWCVGCHQEIEDLKALHAQHSSRLTILALNYNEGVDKAQSMIDKYAIPWTNGLSTDEINNGLFVYGLPRNMLIDSLGRIQAMNIDPAKLLEQLKEN